MFMFILLALVMMNMELLVRTHASQTKQDISKLTLVAYCFNNEVGMSFDTENTHTECSFIFFSYYCCRYYFSVYDYRLLYL